MRSGHKKPSTSAPVRDVPGLAARRASIAILSDVLRKRRPLDAALDSALASAKLDVRDAGFARAIATETLRRFGQIEALIRSFVPKAPPPHKAGATLEILYAGVAEILFLNVAHHAAVDAANYLAQGDDKAVHFKALINAVLRRVTREGAGIEAAQDVSLNVPDWLWGRWVAIYGEEEARAIARAHLVRPLLDLTLRNVNSAALFPHENTLASMRVRLPEAGRVDELPGFADGSWWVQDFAASLPVRLLGDVKGARAIDICAAPGGKTMQLAALGADVTALDSSSERLTIVKDNLARTGLNAACHVTDARDWRPETPFPFVLLDAPCTATGTIRRHPDLPWIKAAADIQTLENLQSDLLDAAAEMTAPGGTLVYAVCSLEPEEGVEQVEMFLRRNADFTRVPVTAGEVFDEAFISAKGDLRTLPSHWSDKGGMDGFYAAKLKRSAS